MKNFKIIESAELVSLGFCKEEIYSNSDYKVMVNNMGKFSVIADKEVIIDDLDIAELNYFYEELEEEVQNW